MARAHNIFPHWCSRRLLCPCRAATSGFVDMRWFCFFFCIFLLCCKDGNDLPPPPPGNWIFVDLIFSVPRFWRGVKTRIFLGYMRTFETFVRILNRYLEFRIRRMRWSIVTVSRGIVVARRAATKRKYVYRGRHTSFEQHECRAHKRARAEKTQPQFVQFACIHPKDSESTFINKDEARSGMYREIQSRSQSICARPKK